MVYTISHYSKSQMNDFNQVAKTLGVDLNVILDLMESKSPVGLTLGYVVAGMQAYGLRVSFSRIKYGANEFSFNSKGINWHIGVNYNSFNANVIITMTAKNKKNYKCYREVTTIKKYSVLWGEDEQNKFAADFINKAFAELIK